MLQIRFRFRFRMTHMVGSWFTLEGVQVACHANKVRVQDVDTSRHFKVLITNGSGTIVTQEHNPTIEAYITVLWFLSN